MLHSEPKAFQPKTFAMPLLEWHSRCGRKLPWMTRQPYDVWLSEVMLQQTQVATVLERYASFKQCFPTIEQLAASSVDDVLAQWSGLGYYSRARNLHACARKLVAWRTAHGDWPKEADEWVVLPGVGQSTANAIVSACFDKVAPILDANAKRVLLRFAGDLDASSKTAWFYAEQAMEVDRKQAAQYTQAMMDLGATVCKARCAVCAGCPLKDNCKSVGWAPAKRPKKVVLTDDAMSVKKDKTVVSFDWALCFRDGDFGVEVLMQQRDQSSFWPALWTLPEWSDTRFTVLPGSTATLVKHELSHRSLRIQARRAVLSCELLNNEKWVSVRDIGERKIPVPSPVAGLATMKP